MNEAAPVMLQSTSDPESRLNSVQCGGCCVFDMSSWSIRTLRRVSADLLCLQDGRVVSRVALESFVISLKLVYRDLIAQEQLSPLSTSEKDACDIVLISLRSIKSCLEELVYSEQVTAPPILHTGRVGRPKFIIPRQQLEFSLKMGSLVIRLQLCLGCP